MNTKKILLFTVILMIAISSLSMVSAGWFDFGKTTVNGIEFNVSGLEEFTHDTGLGQGVLKKPIIGIGGANSEIKSFKNENGNSLVICVYDITNNNSNNNLTLDNIQFNGVSSDSKLDLTNSTHGDKKGVELSIPSSTPHHTESEFAYIEDGKLVVLHIDNKGGTKGIYASDVIGHK